MQTQTISLRQKVLNGFFVGIILLAVILLFTLIDHAIHGLKNIWGVPDYYFKDKIPAGFFWGVVGLFLAKKFKNIWLKALMVAGLTVVALQVRYFLTGYPLSFVLIFLLFHFVILFFLLAAMFAFLKRYKSQMPDKNYSGKDIISALIILAILGIATYYFVFGSLSYIK